jgi:hypothetical protein
VCWQTTDCPVLVMVPGAVQVPAAAAGSCQGARWTALLTGRQLTNVSSSDRSATMMRGVTARLPGGSCGGVRRGGGCVPELLASAIVDPRSAPSEAPPRCLVSLGTVWTPPGEVRFEIFRLELQLSWHSWWLR